MDDDEVCVIEQTEVQQSMSEAVNGNRVENNSPIICVFLSCFIDLCLSSLNSRLISFSGLMAVQVSWGRLMVVSQ